MIEKIVFNCAFGTDPSSDYILNLPALKANNTIEFKAGLNVIVGPNGSGKSSILKAIAHQLGANHTGVSLTSSPTSLCV